jgi:DNA-binding NarL/FixJ family response regulator
MDNHGRVTAAESSVEEGIPLNDREKEILKFIFDGNSSSDVATLLSVSKRTVDFHLARAYVKMGVTNRIQAYQKAIDMGIIKK